MRHLLIFIIMGWVSLAMYANDEASKLDDFIISELEAAGLPGVSYAIVDGDASVVGAHGVADLSTGEAITTDTRFQIGSISKSFTAIAILQLMESGELDLDADVSSYLSVFEQRTDAIITIRQLLAHTSGYSTLQGNEAYIDATGNGDELSKQAELIAGWSPAYPPGSQWDYSNANYILLGAIIEAVSGLKYDYYLEANILQPIGMNDSLVGDGGRYDKIAVGHTPWFGSKRPIKNFVTTPVGAPAGGILASANDLALYLETLLNGEDDIISAESKAQMIKPADDQLPFYGFGWMLNSQDGAAYHTGTSPGTDTLAIFLPEARKGAVVLVNAGSGMGFGETANLINGISAKALGRDFVRDQSSWGRKLLFLTFALQPVFFGIGIIQAWRGRTGLREKSGAFGAFSLWFPLLATAVLAWVSVFLIPNLFGVSLATLGVFSPDFSIALLATALSGLIWAVFRLCVYYRPGFPR